MRVLLSDGSGLTARQSAARLWEAGHHVDVLSPDPLCICRFTRHVQRVRRVPAYGADPFAWLNAALEIYAAGGYDVLLPTQEQVAVLAALPGRLAAAGVVSAVPSFRSLAAVQDKISAFATLRRIGVPQPPAAVDPDGWDTFPAYVKQPIGTASGGVRRVTSPVELAGALRESAGPVLVQAAVAGPLAMCQAVFDAGSLVAFHANLRVAEGANGGASHKRSVELAEARRWLEVLGGELAWHGALSADVIVSHDGPVFIDINPRLVEPANGWYAGVDLVAALLGVALDSSPAAQGAGRPGVATHQTLLAVLGAAQQGAGRRGVLRQLVAAGLHRGDFTASREELTPLRGDPLSAVPVALAAVATLLRPEAWRWFVSGSVDSYALTAPAWRNICAVAQVSESAT